MQQTGRLDRAVESYAKAVELDPSLDTARAQLLHFKAQICDWSAYTDFKDVAETLGLAGEIVSPWPLLGFEDAPDRQRQRSAHYARQWQRTRHRFAPGLRKDRLRIGYFSSDLYDHATLSLMNGVFEHHDKETFDVRVYGLNTPRQSTQSDRMKAAVSGFIDLHDAGDDNIISKARADGLDIAIDLKGYTQDARPGPFFAGLAPVQINYLGYPGTLGTGSYDYIIADETVIPEEHAGGYTESVIYLPNSYQPNDGKQTIAQLPIRRADYGLPEDAVVLCCFNQSYKISPQEFDIWMRVLRRHPQTVLWLLGCNPWAQKNLCHEAEQRGVSADRVIFAGRECPERHIARHRLADLFLDTFNVNAHTTASEALRAGLPVITRPGKQFAARVGASLCVGVGLEDLVATDDQQYEQIILDLAANPGRLMELRERLSRNLPSAPLFDTRTYTRHLESGYRAAWERWQEGRAPSTIHVKTCIASGEMPASANKAQSAVRLPTRDAVCFRDRADCQNAV